MRSFTLDTMTAIRALLDRLASTIDVVPDLVLRFTPEDLGEVSG